MNGHRDRITGSLSMERMKECIWSSFVHASYKMQSVLGEDMCAKTQWEQMQNKWNVHADRIDNIYNAEGIGNIYNEYVYGIMSYGTDIHKILFGKELCPYNKQKV